MTAGSRDLDSADGARKLEDVLRIFERAIGLKLRVAIPGRVVTFTANPPRATVSTESLTVVRGNTPATAEVETTLPPMPLPNVPVLFPRGVSGAGMRFVLVPGDTGLLVFLDRSLREWKRLGIACDPKDSRAHSIANGVFIPGLFPDTTPPAPISPANTLATIIDGPSIALGGLATLGVARTTDAVAPTAAMATWMAQVQAILTSPGVAAAAGGLPPPVPPADFGVIAGGSTKTRAE